MALIECSECSAEISSRALSCPKCGFPLSPEQEVGFPELTETELLNQMEFQPILEKGERILINKELASYIKAMINVDPGFAYLTTHRIVFCGEFGKFMKLAAVPVLSVMTAGALPKIHFQVLLRHIDKIEITRYGLGKTLLIHSDSGEKYKLGLRNIDKWRAELEENGVVFQ